MILLSQNISRKLYNNDLKKKKQLHLYVIEILIEQCTAMCVNRFCNYPIKVGPFFVLHNTMHIAHIPYASNDNEYGMMHKERGGQETKTFTEKMIKQIITAN